MKILHIDNYYLPSLGYEAELARTQSELGHEVSFAASNRIPAEKGAVPDSVESRIQPEVKSFLLTALAIRGRILLLPGIVQILWRVRPEAVHCHSIFDLTAVVVALLKPLLGYRLVYCNHASDRNTDSTSTWRRRLAYRIYRTLFGRLLKTSADRIVASAEREMAMAIRELRLPPDEIQVLRLGVAVERFDVDATTSASYRKGLNIDDEVVVLLHAGTLESRKRLGELIEAASRLGDEIDRIRLLFVGGGTLDYIDELYQLSEVHGVRERIEIVGHYVSKDKLVEYYASADVGVWPGIYSIATLEAMAAGLPIIVAGDDDYSEFLVSNGNGHTYTPGDTEALAALIIAFVSDKDKRLEMGDASKELVRKEFAWRSIAENAIDLYTA